MNVWETKTLTVQVPRYPQDTYGLHRCTVEVVKGYYQRNNYYYIEVIGAIFSMSTVPEQLVTENIHKFSNEEFRFFLCDHGRCHITSEKKSGKSTTRQLRISEVVAVRFEEKMSGVIRTSVVTNGRCTKYQLKSTHFWSHSHLTFAVCIGPYRCSCIRHAIVNSRKSDNNREWGD